MNNADITYRCSKGLLVYRIEIFNKLTRKNKVVAIIPRWIPKAESLSFNIVRGLEIIRMFNV